MFDVNDKINAMLKKLQLFEIKIKAGDVSAFPALESFMSENKLALDDGVRDNIVAHIVSLRQQFRNYYPVSAEVNNWMRNPFTVEVTDMPEDFSTGEQESILELSCDETLKSDFKRISLLDFWIQRHGEYPVFRTRPRGTFFHSRLHICARKASHLLLRSRQNTEAGWTPSQT